MSSLIIRLLSLLFVPASSRACSEHLAQVHPIHHRINNKQTVKQMSSLIIRLLSHALPKIFQAVVLRSFRTHIVLFEDDNREIFISIFFIITDVNLSQMKQFSIFQVGYNVTEIGGRKGYRTL